MGEIPKFLSDMYSEALKRANRELKTAQNKKRKLVPFPEGSVPGICVANFYSRGGSVQEHQDNTESKESISAGLPVIGFCIGDSCDFTYSNDAPGGRSAK